MPTYTTTGPGGDVLLANAMPQAEYMYGCTPTAVAMLLGYYDLYGYRGEDLSDIIDGEVSLKSRGTDGDAYDMDAFDTVLGRATASEEYVYRFYSRNGTPTTPEQEYSYTFESDGVTLNTDEWNCIADYIGTGQYWRGNGNLSTSIAYDSLEHLYSYDFDVPVGYGENMTSCRYIYTCMLVGLDMYVQSRGYAMDYEITGSYMVDCAGGEFTFDDYMREIDFGRPVLISIQGHSMVGYGYNPATREIIFDDCYQADRRMVWDGTYYYSGAERSLQSITVIGINLNGDVDLSVVNTAGSSDKLILAGTPDALSTPEYCFAGATVYLTYTVSNTGSKESGSFYSTVRVDGEPVSSSSIESIAGSSTRKVANLSLGELNVGIHNVHVILDESNDIQELSGKNNAAEADILILKSGTSIVSGTKYIGNGETVRDTYVKNNGNLILSNGSAFDTILKGKITSSSANGGIWYSPAAARVSQGGYMSGTDIGGYGEVNVSSGGTAVNTNVFSNGSACIYSGGTVVNTNVFSKGAMDIDSGGKLTGQIRFDNGADVTFYDGGILDFDLSGVSPDKAARVNDLSIIYGTPLYTLTVDGTQVSGTYRLADGASGFGTSITVQNAQGATLGTLTPGQKTTFENVDYTLNLTDGVLSVEVVSSVVPEPEPEPVLEWRGFTGDFDGDGKAMLATQKDGVVTIYANGAEWGNGLALDPGWEVVGTGDFNADKKDDFLRVNTEGYVVGEMSQGDGTFAAQVLNLKSAGWSILGTGDFNHNGSDDVLIANPTAASETVGLLGYWESGVTWTLINGYSAEWEMVSCGDFNGDGRCDMLWKNEFVGAGDLTYNAYCTWIVEEPVDWRMVSVANPDEWNFLCSGDFDGNGSHDIAMINDVGVVGIWGVNDGYLNSWSILSAVTAEWTLAGVGDFNGDGTDDIAWSNTDTGLTGYWQINGKELTAWANLAHIV